MQLKKKHRRFALKSKRRCWYCGDVLTRRTATKDHQMPKSRNGTDDPDNIVLACRSCNIRKDDMTVETYRYYLKNQLPAGVPVIFFGERVLS